MFRLTYHMFGLSELLYGEGEIGVGIGFVAQGEMPPFAVERPEAVAQHGIAKYHAVGKLYLRDCVVRTVCARDGVASTIGMAFAAKPIKCAAHVNFFLGTHVEYCEVNR